MSTYLLSQNGSDTTGDGSISNPCRTWNGLWNAGKILQAGDTLLLTAGGTYDKINIGACPNGLTVDATGSGPRPVVAGLFAFGGYNPPQNVKFKNLSVQPLSGNDVGLNILNGFSNLIIEGIDVSGFITNIALISADGSFSTNTVVRKIFTREAWNVGFIVGNTNGLTIESSVGDHCGWLPTGRPPDQCHNFYIQHLNCTNVTINNCYNGRARMNGFRGCGNFINNCLSIDCGNGFAADILLQRMVYCFAICSHDPDPATNKFFGSFATFDHCANALVANCLAAAGRSLANSHAVSFGGCTNTLLKNFVAYDWNGDCLSFDGEPTNGNKLLNVRLHQPTATNGFINAVPSDLSMLPATWNRTSIIADRTAVADNRASIPAILNYSNANDLCTFAEWLYADATRLKQLMDWVAQPYLSLLLKDMNNDGVANILDYNAFLNLFASRDPRADTNNDGQFNVLDFNTFLNLMAE